MKNEKPWYVPFKETYCQWSSAKMCEQDNWVVITLFSIILLWTKPCFLMDYNKIYTILELI